MSEAGGRGPRTMRAGDEDPPAHRGRRVCLLLTGADTGGRFALLETVERRGGAPPRHKPTPEVPVV